ncbi:hypothetical protein D3C71_752390 [compost metagenome]
MNWPEAPRVDDVDCVEYVDDVECVDGVECVDCVVGVVDVVDCVVGVADVTCVECSSSLTSFGYSLIVHTSVNCQFRMTSTSL